MKTFIVCAFDKFYPSGGMNDFKDSFDTLEQAKDFTLTLKEYIIQIYDCEKEEIVFQTDRF